MQLIHPDGRHLNEVQLYLKYESWPMESQRPELASQLTGLGLRAAELDGQSVDPAAIPQADDGRTHQVRIVIGPSGPTDPNG